MNVELIKKKMARAKAEKNKEAFIKYKTMLEETVAETEEVEVEAEAEAPKKKVAKKAPVKKAKKPVGRNPEEIVDIVATLFKENNEEGRLKIDCEAVAAIAKTAVDAEMVADLKNLFLEAKLHADIIDTTWVFTKIVQARKAKKLSKAVVNRLLKELAAEEAEAEE